MDVNRNLDFLKLMNSYSLNVGSCSCLVNGSVEDFLRCAPCPPPTMTYKEFRDNARNQTLETKDICIISKRCFGNSTALTVDCPPSLFVCPETSTTDKVPTTNPPPSDVLKTALIIVGIVILIACVLGYICFRRWRRGRQFSSKSNTEFTILRCCTECYLKRHHKETRPTPITEITEKHELIRKINHRETMPTSVTEIDEERALISTVQETMEILQLLEEESSNIGSETETSFVHTLGPTTNDKESVEEQTLENPQLKLEERKKLSKSSNSDLETETTEVKFLEPNVNVKESVDEISKEDPQSIPEEKRESVQLSKSSNMDLETETSRVEFQEPNINVNESGNESSEEGSFSSLPEENVQYLNPPNNDSEIGASKGNIHDSKINQGTTLEGHAKDKEDVKKSGDINDDGTFVLAREAHIE